MPFKSSSQMRWMFLNKPEMAHKWAAETPNIKSLPMHKKKQKTGMSKGIGVSSKK